jgi:anaerobic magnesium-protoporphyrin IX monomethyl ester cyclase
LRKLGADVAVLGECEETLVRLAADPGSWRIHSWHRRVVDGGDLRVQGGPQACDMQALPALAWPDEDVSRHRHHHHRFDAAPSAPGAEMEVSRGCPYHCTFCAKENFRDDYRKRPLPVVLEELDGLIRQGVEYVYFIDEIFLPNRELLEALVPRHVKLRHPDPHRSVEPGRTSSCSAGPAVCRSRPAWRASRSKGATCSTRAAGSRPSRSPTG